MSPTHPGGGKVFTSGHAKRLSPPHVASEVSGTSGEGLQVGVTGRVTHKPWVNSFSQPNHKGFWELTVHCKFISLQLLNDLSVPVTMFFKFSLNFVFTKGSLAASLEDRK